MQIRNLELLRKPILNITDISILLDINIKKASVIVKLLKEEPKNRRFYEKNLIYKKSVSSLHVARFLGWTDEMYLDFIKDSRQKKPNVVKSL